MVLEPIVVYLIVCSMNMFLIMMCKQFFQNPLLLNAARRRSSNVCRSVAGLRHLTKNVSIICIELSVSCGELKSSTKEEFPSFLTVLRAADMIAILLVVPHLVSA